jgi:hypothetical protein
MFSLCYGDSESSVPGYIVQQKLYRCNTYLFCPHVSHLKLLVLVIYICPELFLHRGEEGWMERRMITGQTSMEDWKEKEMKEINVMQ